MAASRAQWIDDLLGDMDLRRKIGQVLVFGFCGPVITPDVVELIRTWHVGGLRVSLKFRSMNLFHDVKPGTQPEEWTLRSMHLPEGPNRDYAFTKPSTHCTPAEYATTLNTLRQLAMERAGGAPIHFTIDQEGSASDDLICGQKLFPHPMGLTASGDPELAYRTALCIGKQARAVGINMIHSPVLDVNTNPRNPEIGTRAYSDDPDEVIRYATRSMEGFLEAGMIPTGKHFPGRGESISDAHWGLPSVDLPARELREVHLAPYRAMIDAGLPAIMMAHCLYPALGVTDEPSSCSRPLIQELLRGELGFKGVITTDNMMMGGLLQKYELREAVLRTLQAGCDLVLLRDESPLRWKICDSLEQAVRDGRLPENELDEKVRRILGMRWDMGLAENGGKVDPAGAGDPIHDPVVSTTAREAAERSILLVRDERNLLPLDPGRRILLVEQVFPTHEMANNMDCHPGLLWEEMLTIDPDVASVEIHNVPTDDDRARVRRRLDEADIVVATNYYYHKAASSNSELCREILAAGKELVIVSNTPYELGAPADLPAAIAVFNPGGREHCRAAAELIYGKLTPSASLPVKI